MEEQDILIRLCVRWNERASVCTGLDCVSIFGVGEENGEVYIIECGWVEMRGRDTDIYIRSTGGVSD